MEGIITIVVGVVLICLGIVATRGNVSMLHSYHRKRVSKEDMLPFGRLVGAGNILVGVGVILLGVFSMLAVSSGEGLYVTLAYVIFGIFAAIGIGISLYAMMKYNKGIF